MCQVLSSPASQAVNSPRRHVSHPTIPYHVLPPGILPVEYSQQLLVQPGEYLHLPQPFGLSFSQSAGLGFLGDFAFFDAFGLSFAVALAGDLRAADGLFLTAAPLASCSAWSACMDCNGLKGGAGRREVERSTPLLWGRGEAGAFFSFRVANFCSSFFAARAALLSSTRALCCRSTSSAIFCDTSHAWCTVCPPFPLCVCTNTRQIEILISERPKNRKLHNSKSPKTETTNRQKEEER